MTAPLAALVAALPVAFGSASAPLILVDQAGAPVGSANVTFVDAAGARDAERSSPTGRVAARVGFLPVTADVARSGLRPAHVELARLVGPRFTLASASLAVIGSVAVATGTLANEHELPLATASLDRTQISLTQAQTSDGLLRSLPGYDRNRSNSAFQNYGLSRASFSGAGNDRGLVLVDGFPAQDGFGGQIDWQAYPVDEIVRAELLRGAGSALYGSGAVGGVLDLQRFGPQTGRGLVSNGDFALAQGSNDALGDAFLGRAPLGDRVGVSLASSIHRFRFSALPPAYASPIDHPAVSDSATTHAQGEYSHGRTTVRGGALLADDEQNEGRPNYRFARYLHQAEIAATQGFGPLTARGGYYARDTTVYNVADVFPAKPGTLRYNQRVPTDENGFYGSLAATPGSSDVELVVDQKRVVGSSRQTGVANAFQAFGQGVELTQGIGLQGTIRSNRAEVLLGVRADRVRYDDLFLATLTAPATKPATTVVPGHDEGAVSPRIALRYDLGSRLTVRASSGGGFRAPYLNELVRGFNVGAIVMAPNPQLAPERSLTTGFGFDELVGAGRLSIDLIETRVDNAITFATITKTLYVRENFERTKTDGGTLAYVAPVGHCSRVRASATVQNARIVAGPTGSLGNQLQFVPTSSASLGLDDAGPGPFSYSVDGAYLGQTYYDD